MLVNILGQTTSFRWVGEYLWYLCFVNHQLMLTSEFCMKSLRKADEATEYCFTKSEISKSSFKNKCHSAILVYFHTFEFPKDQHQDPWQFFRWPFLGWWSQVTLSKAKSSDLQISVLWTTFEVQMMEMAPGRLRCSEDFEWYTSKSLTSWRF